MNKNTAYALIALLLTALQTTAVHLLNLEGVIPDLPAVLIVYIALVEGQMAGMLWGFGIGLAIDLTTQDFIGLAALTKTLLGFLTGYFFNENKTKTVLTSYRFILIVFMATLVQNLIYFVVFTQGTEIGVLRAIVQYGLTTTLYTAIVSLFPVFYFSRRPPL